MYKTYVVTESYKATFTDFIGGESRTTNYPLATLKEAFAKLEELKERNKEFNNLYFDYTVIEKEWDSITDVCTDWTLVVRELG